MDHKIVIKPASRPRSRSPFVLGGLALVLIAVLVRGMRSTPAAARGATPGEPSQSSGQLATPSQRELAPLVIDWPLDPARDPFTPLESPPPPAPATMPATRPAGPDRDKLRMEAASAVNLQAILITGKPAALIDGALYRAGDTVNGFLVKRVDHRSIIVEREGVDLQISLP